MLQAILIGLSLSIDAFVASITVCAANSTAKAKQIFKMVLFFGLAQGIMPLLGWLLGSSVYGIIEGVDHYIALILLLLIGGKMILDTVKQWEDEKKGLAKEKTEQDLSTDKAFSFNSLFLLALATSIDALAVGITLAFEKINIAMYAIVISIVTGMMVYLGATIGKTISGSLQKYANIFGGVVLIALGIKIFLSHIMA